MRKDLLPTTWRGKYGRVIEECGEVLKAAGKLERFGTKATDPKTGLDYDNLTKLYLEINHLQHAIREFKKHRYSERF
jgi:hypothetical protein